jgi:para-nitrobenzyl esterase
MVRIAGLACSAAALRAKAFAAVDPAPLATTSAGRISGVVEDGINVFKGVPYGEDSETTRFRAPQPVARWSNVRECVQFGHMAPQIVSGQPPTHGGVRTSSSGVPGAPADHGEQSEDCLNLNVFTPGLRDGKKRPVLVYFHGGAYNNGTVNNDLYDGKRLCHRGNVVVVTVNHRLNGFGYMYLGDRASEFRESGNAGQLDLVLALKWVRDNIAEFGGDAKRVLIFGQSGGGAKCAALMATPVAAGLFHRVMTMSGQQIKGASTEIASNRAKAVLDACGVAADLRGAGLVKKLDGLTMQELQVGIKAVSSDWLPVVDGVVLPRNPFDPDAPKLSERVPMILGNTHDETNVPGGPDMTWEQAPMALKGAISEYLGPYSAEEVVAEFRTIHPAFTPLQVDTAAATAFRAWAGQRMEAQRRAENAVSQPRTWVYQVNFQGGNGRAMHTIDIPLYFDNVAMATGQLGTDPKHLAEANALAAVMSSALIAYARTGDPNGDGTVQGLPHWPAYDVTRRATMIWANPPQVEDDPRGAERVFADKSHYHQAGTPLP